MRCVSAIVCTLSCQYSGSLIVWPFAERFLLPSVFGAQFFRSFRETALSSDRSRGAWVNFPREGLRVMALTSQKVPSRKYPGHCYSIEEYLGAGESHSHSRRTADIVCISVCVCVRGLWRSMEVVRRHQTQCAGGRRFRASCLSVQLSGTRFSIGSIQFGSPARHCCVEAHSSQSRHTQASSQVEPAPSHELWRQPRGCCCGEERDAC